jgi:hypothetical protein
MTGAQGTKMGLCRRLRTGRKAASGLSSAKYLLAKARKRKAMKENERKTAFICFHNFSESGHFNGLRPIQIKKVFPFEPEANAKSHFGAAA